MPTKNGGNIKFNVDFNVNKNSLNQINESLRQVQLEASKNPLDENFKKAAQSARQLQNIFKQSWNDKLGQLNLSKFNQDLKNSGQTVNSLKSTLAGVGESGKNAFNQIALEVLHTNTQMKQTSKLLDSMATSMANTVKWGITSSIFNNVTGAIQQAYYFTKDLDTSLNNIRIVTGDSADEMDRFAKTANEAAKSLGKSTLDYTKAALTFYQQGLSDEQVRARTQTTLKAQNVTGSGSEMADYLTAVWNGFKISAEDTEQIVDKLAKVADSSASDMSQLAIAMSKVAATANVMGVDVDQLTAQLATVIATTRQAPESVGTAFKTIYARLNDIKTGADGAEISLGNYSGKMAELGFNVLDANGRLRDTGQVMEQIGSRWDTLTKEQQVYLAQTMGGMRQVTQITALFENWTTYSELLNDSLTAQGSLNEKNDTYLESVKAHLNQLNAEVERTYQILSDTGTINAVVDAFDGALTIFNNFISGLGGGVNTLTYFGSLAVGIFNKQISESILRTKRNLDLMFDTKNVEKFKQDYANAIIEINKVNVNTNNTVQYEALNRRAEKEVEIYTETLKIRKNLTQQQQQELDTIQKKLGELEQEKTLLSNLNELKSQYGYEDYTTTTQFEIREKSLKNQAKQLGILLSLLKERFDLETRISSGDADNAEVKRYKQVGQQLAKNNNFLRIQEDLIKKGYSGEQLTNKIIEQINEKYKISKTELETVLKLKELQIKADEQSEEKLKEQENILVRMLNKLKESAHQRDFTQTLVKGVSSLGQVLSVAAGAMKTFGDETSTTEDKVQASISGVQGLISALSPLLPGGFATTTLLNGAISLITELTGFDDFLAEHFSTTAQKIQKVNQAIKETNTQISSTKKNVSSLQEMAEEYATLAEKAGQYGSTIENLTQEEKDRYFELNNKFAEYNESVIAGWDSQGNAIIANQEKVKDLIKLYRDAQKENINQNLDIQGSLSTKNEELNQPYEKYKEEKAKYSDYLSVSSNQIPNSILLNGDYEDIDSFFNSIQERFKEQYNGYKSTIINSLSGESYIPKDAQAYNEIASVLLDATRKTIKEMSQTNEEFYELNEDQLLVLMNFRDIIQPLIDYSENPILKSLNSIIDTNLQYREKFVELENALKEKQQFDDNFITTVLEWGKGYSDQYEQLYASNLYDDNIEQIFLDYIRGFLFDPQKVFDETGILIDENGNKYAKDYESIIEYGQAFAQNLATALNQYENEINTVIENYNNGNYDERLQGKTFKEKNEQLAKILNETLANLDFSSIEDKNVKKGLIDYLASIFNIDLSTLKINFDNKDAIVQNVQSQSSIIIDKIAEGFQEQLNKMGIDLQLADLIKDSLGQLSEQDIPILQSIDWSKVLDSQSFKTAFDEAKARIAQISNNAIETLNNTIGADTIIEKVSKNKNLTKDEQQYLSLLLQQDSTLLSLKDRHEEFSNAVYAAQEKIQQKYRENLEAQKQQAEIRQANAELELNAAKTEEEKQIATEKVIKAQTQAAMLQQQLDVANATWNIENGKRLEQETKNLKKATKQARDLLNQNYQRENTIQTDATSGLKNLKDKKALSNDQLSAVIALELQDQKLNQIAEERSRHSKEYIAQLEKSLQQHELITQELRRQKLETLELEKAQLSNQKRGLEEAIRNNQGNELVLNNLQQQLTDVNNDLAENAKEIASVVQDEFEDSKKAQVDISKAIEQHQKVIKQSQKEIQQNQKTIEEHKQNVKKLNQQELKDFQNILNTLKDSNSIIKDLKNHSLNADQLQAISYLMQVDQNFANIVNQSGYFSDATIDTLEQLLNIQKQITAETKEQLTNRLQSERTELQTKRDRLQNIAIPSEQQYNLAKNLTSNSYAALPQNVRQQYNTMIWAYEHQAQIKLQIKNIDEQIQAIDLQILEINQETTKTAKQNLQTFNTLRDKLAGGQKDLSSSELTELNTILNNLTEIYPELIADADLLRQTQLAGTDEYEAALNRVQDILTQLDFEELSQKAAEAFNNITDPKDMEIDIHVNPQEFEKWVNQVEDYLNVDKEIVIAVHTDAEDSFNHLVDEINQIQNAASKIGENFVIAGQDMRMLNQVFPGILENMQYLENGSIKLSETVVKNALATSQNTIQADTESTNAQLDSQAKLLREKAATYRAMAEDAATLAQSESLTSEESAKLQQKIFNALAEQQADSNGEFIAAATFNLSKLTNSSNDNSRAIAENTASAATSSTNSFSNFISTTIGNLNTLAAAFANAMQGRTTNAWISGANGTGPSYSGRTGAGTASGIKKGSSIKVGSKVSSALTQQDWARLSEQLFNQANIYEQQANDIEGMKYLLDARLQGLNKGISNISSGHDWSGPKEQTKSSRSSSPRGSSRSSGDELDDGSDLLDDGTGGQQQDPEFLEFIEDAKDLYHDVNIQLRKIEIQLERVRQQQQRLIGADVVSGLNKQLDLLNQQIDSTKEKIELQRQEARILKQSLLKFGVNFNPNNTIANYSDIMTHRLNAINEAIAMYNSLDAVGQQTYKPALEEAKERYQLFLSQIERYEEIITQEIPDLTDEIRDAIDQQIEANIKKFNLIVDIELDLTKAERKWNDFVKDVILQLKDEDILENTQFLFNNLTTYFRQGNDQIDVQIRQIQRTMEELSKLDQGQWSQIYGDDMASALNDLNRLQNSLMDSLQDAEQLINKIKDSIFDGIDKAQSAFDDQINEYQYISQLINHNVKLVELLYGKDSYDMMTSFYEDQEKNNNKEIEFLRLEKDMWHNKMVAQQERLNPLDFGSNYYKQAEKRLKQYEQHWMKATKELNNMLETSIQNIINKYSNAIEIIFNNLEKKMTNGSSLSAVAEEWELINKQANVYLDRVNSMYEIEKLQKAYQDAIDNNSNNLDVQKSLNDMMEEQIKYLKDKDKLTKYDVDRANALLQIEIKRLAVEQAAQNKTKLRLRRDNQGNYTYQYVADQEEEASTQNDLAAAQNDLYNLTKNAYKENLNSLYSSTKQWQDKIKEVYADTTLTVEEQQQKITMYNEYYGNIINGYTEQNEQLKRFMAQDTVNALKTMYETNTFNFSDMKDEEVKLIIELIKNYDNNKQAFSDLTDSQKKDFETLKSYYDTNLRNFVDMIGLQQNSLGRLITNYQENKSSFKNMTTSQREQLELLVQNYYSNLSVFKTMTSNQKDALEKLIGKYKDNAFSFGTMSESQQRELHTLLAEYQNLGIDFDNLTNGQKQALGALIHSYQENSSKFTDMTDIEKNSLQQLSDKYDNNLQDYLFMTSQERAALGTLIEAYDNNLTSFEGMTSKERAELKELIKQYEDNVLSVDNMTEDEKAALKTLGDAYGQNVSAFDQMTEQQRNIMMQKMIPQWDSTINTMADTFVGNGGFIPTVSDAFDELDKAAWDYQSSLDWLSYNAGVDFDNVRSSMDPIIEDTQLLLDENQFLIDQYDNEITAIDRVIGELDKLTNKYKSTKDAAINAISAAKNYWSEMQKQTQRAAARDFNMVDNDYLNNSISIDDYSYVPDITFEPTPNVGRNVTPSPTSSSSSISTPSRPSTSSGSSGGGTSAGSATSASNSANNSNSRSSSSGLLGDGIPRIGDYAIFETPYYHEDSYGEGKWGSQFLGKKVQITYYNPKGSYPYGISQPDGQSPWDDLGWVKLQQLSGYDTGGYTGNWSNNNGKLALLHEKELVLNKEDTRNILSAVSIVKTMSDLLSNIQGNSGLSSTGFLNKNRTGPYSNNQQIHIDANFPNVSSHLEIEQALINLANKAQQYAFSTK